MSLVVTCMSKLKSSIEIRVILFCRRLVDMKSLFFIAPAHYARLTFNDKIYYIEINILLLLQCMYFEWATSDVVFLHIIFRTFYLMTIHTNITINVTTFAAKITFILLHLYILLMPNHNKKKKNDVDYYSDSIGACPTSSKLINYPLNHEHNSTISKTKKKKTRRR